MVCNPLRLLSKRGAQAEKSYYHDEPISIEIQTIGPNRKETWRVAILSYEPGSDMNMISQKLVTNTLGASIQPIDSQGILQGHNWRGTEDVNGFVDLTWRFEMKNGGTNNTRFFVTSDYDPPFDAVLGKNDAQHVGILQ